MRVKEKIKKIIEQILLFIYPPFCVLCDQVLPHKSLALLCPNCKATYPILHKDLCVICSKPLQDTKNQRCLDCRKRVHFYEEGKALWVYEGHVKEAIKNYKYHDRQEIGVAFAKVMARHYSETIGWTMDLVLPVPLHPKKLKERGFDQTMLMAKIFCDKTGNTLNLTGLRRITFTKNQEGLSDKSRIKNVYNAFEANGQIVKGKDILLIDDVYTTGATIDGCAKALVDAGANNIYFMSIAIGRGY